MTIFTGDGEMASFIRELKRRNVFKVGVAYAIVAWLLIQIIVAIEAPLRLPEWMDTFIILLLVIGFPVTLIMAWAYELTPEGIKSTKSIAPEDSIRESTGQKLNHLITGMVVLAILYLIVDNYVLEESQQVPEPVQLVEVAEPERLPNSVAMLPCDNLSPDPDNAYFAAGIHESTLNQLAKIRDINLIARSTVMQYADNRPPIPDIAEALNVEMVMECSVRYANNEVLITIQLIDGITGTHIDSEEYPGDLTDIFGIQGEIAVKISSELQAELLPEEQQRIQKFQTDSAEALALYLKASNILVDPTGNGPNDELHQYLDQAIQLDPAFARAHALKAFDYSYAMVRSRLPDDPDSEQLEQLIYENVGAALTFDIDENLAYIAIGNLNRIRGRVNQAEAGFERAFEIAPNDVENLNAFYRLYILLNEYERAIELAEHIYSMDPTNPSLGVVYTSMGNYEEAKNILYEVLRVDPNNHAAHESLFFVEFHLNDLEASRESLMMLEKLSPNTSRAHSELAMAYGMLGYQEDARRHFESLEQLAETSHVRAGDWARAYAGIEEVDEVLRWLEYIDVNRAPEDMLVAYYDAINWANNPTLEHPKLLAVRESLRLRRE